jgi:hypothetical protein
MGTMGLSLRPTPAGALILVDDVENRESERM